MRNAKLLQDVIIVNTARLVNFVGFVTPVIIAIAVNDLHPVLELEFEIWKLFTLAGILAYTIKSEI